MQLRYNFRLYPTSGQQAALARTFGCARTVFNDGLRVRQEAHQAGNPYIKDTDLQKQIITAAKKTPERAWLAEVSSVALVQALNDLHTAYRNFFSSVTGRRKGPKVQAPASGHGRTTGSPFGLPVAHSACAQTVACTSPGLVRLRCAGLVTCQPIRRR